MARPIRIEFPNAIYHVMARGNGRADVFERDADRGFFLRLLERVWDRFHLEVHAYCLLSNHYHLLVRTPLGNLARAIQLLNGMYAQWFARDRDRPGHLWGGRYKAKLVDGDDYFLAVSRYIVLNPVEAGLARTVADWHWSSYRATVGEVGCPPFLVRSLTLGILDPDAVRAAEVYRRITGVLPCGPAPELHAFASPEFIRRLASMVEERAHREALIPERHMARPPIADLLPAGLARSEWEERVRIGWEEHGYSLRQMARALGCHPSSLSGIVRHGVRSKKDGERGR